MRNSHRRLRVAAALWTIATGLMLGVSPAVAAELEDLAYFEQQVRPLLVKHCYECHSHRARRLEAGLYLDSREGMLQGGDSGPAVVPAHPEQSRLIEAVRYESFEMPPQGRLSAREIEILVQWIRNGAAWPQEAASAAVPAQKTFDWKHRRSEHWSWQSVQEITPPDVEAADWPRSEIDRFILAGLQRQQLQPARDAPGDVWLRRVCFDLIGLPPTPEQLQTFLEDPSPQARERIVDELLRSPHFGEKWARHWMDLVRYAETYGHEFDYPILAAWRYRDYLIRALNADVPYDQLVREHLAGDLLEAPRRHPQTGENESIIGTGFWFLGEAVHAPTDVYADLSTRIENQIDVMSRAFLGLSVACARCHDHKFDAISKEDYYALYGILNSSHRDEAWLDPHGRIAASVRKLGELQAGADAALRTALAADPLAEPDIAAKWLAAVSDVLQSSPAGTPDENVTGTIMQVAAEHDLDAGLLERWVSAMRDPALASPSHPLHALSVLLPSPEEKMDDACVRLQSDLSAQADRASTRRHEAVCVASFDRADWADWMTTGPAFGAAPVTGVHGLFAQDSLRLAAPGSASSGAASARLRGTLRSPTFTLEHPYLHTRLRASGVTIRLVIENYFMDQFQPLLFKDATRKNIDTKGNWEWVSQGGDLQNHLGRRAYIEVIDSGNGACEIDEIWLSRDPHPPAQVSAASMALVDSLDSRRDLTRTGAEELSRSLRTAGQGEATVEGAEVVNWLLQHRLVHSTEPLLNTVREQRELANSVPEPVSVLAITEGSGIDEPVHIRGSDQNFGERVPRRFLLALAGEQQPPILQGSGRRDLALLMTRPNNPFLSRVMVNRLWHHLFGRGIVPSVDDFGVMGQPPTHPELLDWLARDFERHGYSIKHAIRQMVLSRTYGLSSRPEDAAAEQQDPDNLWLHRMSVRRLPAESIRDALLAVSGRLDPAMFGPSIPVHITPFMQGRGQPRDSGPLDGDGRRSIYQEVRRNFLSPLMLTFDMPSPFSCMGRRSSSNVPAQALILMNDPFVVEQAGLWARASLASTGDPHRRIDQLFTRALGRGPTVQEHRESLAFLRQQAALYGAEEDDLRVWGDLCHMLFNMKEFLFLQ